jgi:hypothetical protein
VARVRQTSGGEEREAKRGFACGGRREEGKVGAAGFSVRAWESWDIYIYIYNGEEQGLSAPSPR